MLVCIQQVIIFATLWRLSSAYLAAQSGESYNTLKDGPEGDPAMSTEVCPFKRPCICGANRIHCIPDGPLVTVSSEAASKIMWYDMRIERLQDISHLPSSAPLSVKNLHITRSELSSVPIGILSELTGVLQLNLSRNKIDRLRGNDFIGVPSLLQLDLGQNLLRNIDETAFEPLSDLRQLNLAMNSLLTVPVALRSLRKLTHLDLHGNPIKVISDYDFNHLGRLLNLDLSQLSPGLTIGKRAFCGLQSARRVADQIKLETGLNALVMRNNNISEWDPCSLFHLKHLVRSVDFSFTGLQSCPCQAASFLKFFRLTYYGIELVRCVKRRSKDIPCSKVNCTSYCSGSSAEHVSPITNSALTLTLTLCLFHVLMASFLDR